jgi:hypothetical protein
LFPLPTLLSQHFPVSQFLSKDEHVEGIGIYKSIIRALDTERWHKG